MTLNLSETTYDASALQNELKNEKKWRPIVERITKLKDAIDFSSKWPDESKESIWVSDVLKNEGLSIDFISNIGCRNIILMPGEFFKLIIGSYDYSKVISKTDIKIPSWSTIGWIRRDQYLKNIDISIEEARIKLDEITDPHTVCHTTCIAGIPLLFAEEGKNRVFLQHRGSCFRQTTLTIINFDFKNITLRRLAFQPDVLVLYNQNIKNTYHVQILPFAQLSEPLFFNLGIKLSEQVSVLGWLEVFKLIKRKNLHVSDFFRIFFGNRNLLIEVALKRNC